MWSRDAGDGGKNSEKNGESGGKRMAASTRRGRDGREFGLARRLDGEDRGDRHAEKGKGGGAGVQARAGELCGQVRVLCGTGGGP